MKSEPSKAEILTVILRLEVKLDRILARLASNQRRPQDPDAFLRDLFPPD